MNRRAQAVEHALAPFGLPAAIHRVIVETAMRSRLWPSECADIARELATHFEDGRHAGVADKELIETFGDTETTASLIGIARRRGRPPMWRAARSAAVAASVAVAVGAAVYAASAASLYFSTPARMEAASISPRTNAIQAAMAWCMGQRRYQSPIERANLHLDGARSAVSARNPRAMYSHVESAIAISQELRSRSSLGADYAAAQIERDAAHVLIDGIETGRLCPSDPRIAKTREILAEPVRLDGVRAAFNDLLDRMYTLDSGGDGRLTHAGIQVIRRMRHCQDPSLTDRILEPIRFAFPASRRDVSTEFERIVMVIERPAAPDDETADVHRTVRQLEAAVANDMRFTALSAALPRLVDILKLTEEASRARQRAVEALDQVAYKHSYNG